MMNIYGKTKKSLNLVRRKMNNIFFSSSKYWEKRYRKGGDSGVGSYGPLARYKANIINTFVKNKNIQTAIDFGCGDGNQLSFYSIPNYIGLDISKNAIKMCKRKFIRDGNKKFFTYSQYVKDINPKKKADLTLSIDVLYHLVEDAVFRIYLDNLFSFSNNYVIIYSTNFDKIYDSPHQIDRQFTDYIKKNITTFEMAETIYNPCKGEETKSDFFIYRKIT